MWKGTVGEKVVFLVIAVIFMGIVLFVLFRYFPNLINSILINFGLVKPNDLESAILCAIHRCVDGCMNMRLQELSWKENGKTVNCYEKFCAGITSETLIGRAGGCVCVKSPPGVIFPIRAAILPTEGVMFESQRGENSCFPESCINRDRSLGSSCNSDDDCMREIIKAGEKLIVCGDDFPVNITLDKPQKVDISHLLITTGLAPDVSGIIVSEDLNFLKRIGNYFINYLLYMLVEKNILVVHKDAITAYGDQLLRVKETITYKNLEVGIKGSKATVYISTDKFYGLTYTTIHVVPTTQATTQTTIPLK